MSDLRQRVSHAIWHQGVDAAIAIVLEEAARCAEDYAGTGMEIDYIRQSGDASRTRSDIAKAIRALKEKQ